MHDIPLHLEHEGRLLNYANRGRTPGSYLYTDLERGTTVELFRALVVQVGPHFGLAEVPGNAALSSRRIRVDHETLNGRGSVEMDDALLVGPLVFGQGPGPKAHAAWRLMSAKPIAMIGRIHSLKAPDWGFIRPEAGGVDLFFHRSDVQNTPMRVGTRVRYIECRSPRGLAATHVRAA